MAAVSDNKNRLPLSVAIISKDAGAVIRECLESVRNADEIVVVDSGSTDATLEIAREFGAKVLHHEWSGFGPQKQFAVEAASNEWVLCIDTDERVSEELWSSIADVFMHPACDAYELCRRNRFLGRWLKHGEGYPDWVLRLFHRRRAHWSSDLVHERVIATTRVGRLHGDLLHDSAASIESYLAKQNRYTSVQAEAMFHDGERVSASRVVFSPLARFVKFYIFRLGFLDGLPGFVHIAIGCLASFEKYVKIREMQLKGYSE